MLRRNVAGQHLGFALVKASDGTALTGASVAVYRVIDGGAQASATGAVTEKGNGGYDWAPSQADVNGNQISFLFVAATAILVEKTIVTTAADPTDAQRLGLAALPAASTLAVKPAVTLAAADVSGNLPAAVADKTGFSLAAAGLDAITTTLPSTSIGSWTFRDRINMLWSRFFGKATRSTTQIKVYAADGTTVLATSAISDDGAGNESQGASA